MTKMLLRSVLVFCCLFIYCQSAYSQVTQNLDSIQVKVNKYGSILINTLPDVTGQIARTSPLVATGMGAVFDYKNDLDVQDPTQLINNPAKSDYEIYGSYNNNGTGLPPNVIVKENIYCWKTMSSVVVKYTVINNETSPINEIFGLELIPEVSGAALGTDTVTYNPLNKIIGDRKVAAVGYKFLSDNISSLKDFVYFSNYWANDTDLYNMLTYGKIDTTFIIDPANPAVDDPVMVPSVNSKTIAVGDSAIYYIAIGYGYNNNVMAANMLLAQQKYTLITSVKPNYNNIPTAYNLDQNYPNPFNPSTKISYQLQKNGFVSIKVFNVLGKEITTLVNAERTAGIHVVDFNAAGLTSGIYFYSIQSGKLRELNKEIKDKIQNKFEELPKNQRKIANYFVDNFDKVSFLNVHDISLETGASVASVVRFAQ